MRFLIILFSFFISTAVFAMDAEEDVKMEALVNGCIQVQHKDKICAVLVELKQIGDDVIELVKNYADLSPREYALLTAANVIIQGRFRIRRRSWLLPNATDIYDIRKDQIIYTIEKSF